MPGGVEGRDRRRRHDHPVVPVAQIRHRMQHADVGADAHDGHLLRPGRLQQLVQVSFKESRIAPLADQGRLFEKGLELLHHIRLFGPAHAMHGEDLELSIVGIMGVGEKDQLVASAPALLDHGTDPGDRCIAARGGQVARLAKTVEHVDHDGDVRHDQLTGSRRGFGR